MRPRWLAASLLLAVLFASPSIFSSRFLSLATADELLTNGDFEQGASGWTSVGACTGRSGNGGLLTAPSAQTETVAAKQTLAGPFSSSEHVFQGYVRLVSGTPQDVGAVLWWLDASGTVVGNETRPVSPVDSYTVFSVSSTPPPNAALARVEVDLTATATTSICLDDLSLTGDPPQPETPTAIPSATETATPTSSASPSPGSATATATTAAKGTTTPTPTAEPGLSFVNGDFEDGLYGWQKYGGELKLAQGAGADGSNAGRFDSATASTKWAFQTVAIEPGETYAFQGDVATSGAVQSAYLRISWYESGDGSGSTLSTADSPDAVDGASDGFVHLTTGPQPAPENAHSARLRVMLAPASGAGAALLLDNFAFATATPESTPTPTPTPTPSATATPPPSTATVPAADATAALAGPDTSLSPAPAASAKQAPTESNARATPTASAIAQAAGVRVERTATAVMEAHDQPPGGGDPSLPPWPLVAVPAALLAIGAGYVYAQHGGV